MKNINFVNKPNKEISNWLRISLLLLIITIFAISIITIRQLLKLSAIKQEISQYTYKKENLHMMLQKKEALLKQQKKLKDQYDAINKFKTSPKKKLALLEDIYNLIPAHAKLKSIVITKKDIDLQIACSDEKIANWLVQQIAELPLIKNLTLASISKDNTGGLIFNMQGQINKL